MLAQGEILQGELAMVAAEERSKSQTAEGVRLVLGWRRVVLGGFRVVAGIVSGIGRMVGRLSEVLTREGAPPPWTGFVVLRDAK
jgi:hypothetical protein